MDDLEILRGALDRRAVAQADIHWGVYQRPLGTTGLHVITHRCNGEETVVGSSLNGATFAPGSTVPVGSYSGRPGQFIIGSPPPGQGGASFSPQLYPVPLAVAAPGVAPQAEAGCPSFRPVSCYMLADNSIAGEMSMLRLSTAGDVAQTLWTIDRSGEGVLDAADCAVRGDGSAAYIDRGLEGQLVRVVRSNGQTKIWETGLDPLTEIASAPAWLGSQIVLAVRVEAAVTLYRWQGIADLSGMPAPWMSGPAPGELADVPELAISGARIAMVDGGTMFAVATIGSSWDAFELPQQAAHPPCWLSDREVLVGRYVVDLAARMARRWEHFSDAFSLPYRWHRTSGGVAAWPFPSAIEDGDPRLLSCALPPGSATWGEACAIPALTLTAEGDFQYLQVGL